MYTLIHIYLEHSGKNLSFLRNQGTWLFLFVFNVCL